jgi:hypothetical protein
MIPKVLAVLSEVGVGISHLPHVYPVRHSERQALDDAIHARVMTAAGTASSTPPESPSTI